MANNLEDYIKDASKTYRLQEEKKTWFLDYNKESKKIYFMKLKQTVYKDICFFLSFAKIMICI